MTDNYSAPLPACSLTVIIPTLKEKDNLNFIASALHHNLKEIPYEVLFVDDCSQDGTVEICEDLSRKWPIRLIVRPGSPCLSKAVLTGFLNARGTYLIVMDADMSHPASAVPIMLADLKRGADLVIGSRYIRGSRIEPSWGRGRLWHSLLAVGLTSPLVKVKDPMSGFFGVRRGALPPITQLHPRGFKILLELLVKGEFPKIVEIPISFQNRSYGKSKLKLKQQVISLLQIVKLYLYKISRSRLLGGRS